MRYPQVEGVGAATLAKACRGAIEYLDREGGFEEAELRQLQLAACQAIRLGPRVLRTETAGPAVLAALQTLWGDFGPDS